jgi:hypothetical protein
MGSALAALTSSVANAGAADVALAVALLPDVHTAKAVALDLLTVLAALLSPGVDA